MNHRVRACEIALDQLPRLLLCNVLIRPMGQSQGLLESSFDLDRLQQRTNSVEGRRTCCEYHAVRF